jgi:glycosyltransferase involved in cell wall biosynthesis
MNHNSTTPPHFHKENISVCHIVTSFPRYAGDPEVPWLVEALNRLQKAGMSITVFAPSFKGLTDHRIGDIPVKRFRYFYSPFESLTQDEGAPNKIRTPFYKILALFYLIFGSISIFRFCLAKRFDAIHVHWPFPQGLFGFVAARTCRAKLILHFYTAELSLARRWWLSRLFLRFMIKKADLVIAISTYAQEQIHRIMKREVVVIPYGSTFQRKEFSSKPHPLPHLLSVGRLIKRKGLEYLIEAVEILIKKNRALTLTIVGDGDQREHLHRLVVSKKLEGVVKMAGKVSHEELQKCYEDCDLFLFPSIVDDTGDTEGLGVVVLEAMSYGKPVIASHVGGIVDIIQDNVTGLLVKEKDPISLAAAIERLLNNPTLVEQIRQNGFDLLEKQFNWDCIIARWKSITLECVQREPHR